ncbi:hypothetical protein EKO27_g4258 [Xylaria grammica]|uniref:DUF7791 domain-containing protein n=1 Tax=Xylaria grammica TaxID=363999 RepID=A0A439D8X5_9PEZI|nr:hypothetical protein EKO27_g4258 [Xylaria grammica]
MGNSWSLTQLRDALDEIPNDFRLLFDQMLRRVNRLEGMMLARTFILLQTDFSMGPALDLEFTVYAHAVLDDIADNPDLEAQLLDGSPGPYLNDADCNSKCIQMCRRLIGRCQGLLDIIETGNRFLDCHRVDFYQQTVSDFSEEPETASYIQELLGDFNPKQALAHIILARMNFIQPQKPVECRLGPYMLQIISLSTDVLPLFHEVESLKHMAERIFSHEVKT